MPSRGIRRGEHEDDGGSNKETPSGTHGSRGYVIENSIQVRELTKLGMITFTLQDAADVPHHTESRTNNRCAA